MLLKFGLFLAGLLCGGFVVVTVARRLPGLGIPRIAPKAPPLGLVPGPKPLLRLAPPADYVVEVETEAVRGEDTSSRDADDVVIRDRTKSNEIVELRSVPGWEADLRDKGHRRGFIIRIRRKGESEPVEVIQADGMLRAGAREIAVSALRARRVG